MANIPGPQSDIDEEEIAWDKMSMSQFLKGYSEKDTIYDNFVSGSKGGHR